MWKLLLSFALPITQAVQFSSKYHEKSALFADHSRLSLHQSANSTVGFTTGMGESSTKHKIECSKTHNNFCHRTWLGHKNTHKSYVDGYFMKKKRFKKQFVPKYFRIYSGRGWSDSLKWWNDKIDPLADGVKAKLYSAMFGNNNKLFQYLGDKVSAEEKIERPPEDKMKAQVFHNLDNFEYGDKAIDKKVKMMLKLVSNKDPLFKKQFPKEVESVNEIKNATLKSLHYYDILWDLTSCVEAELADKPSVLKYGGHIWTNGNPGTLKMKAIGDGWLGANRAYEIQALDRKNDVCRQPEGTPEQLCPSLADLQQALALMEKGNPEWMKTCKAIESKHPEGVEKSLSLADMCNGIQDVDCLRVAEIFKTYSAYVMDTGCEDYTYDLTLNKPFEPHKVGIEMEWGSFYITTWTPEEANKNEKRIPCGISIDRVLAKTYSLTMPKAPALQLVLEYPKVTHSGYRGGIRGSYSGGIAHVEAIFGPMAKTDHIRKVNGIMRAALTSANKNCQSVEGKAVPHKYLKTLDKIEKSFPQNTDAEAFMFSCFVQKFNSLLNSKIGNERAIADAYTLHLPPFEDEGTSTVYADPDSTFVIKIPDDRPGVKITSGAWAQVNYGVPLSHFGNGAYLDYITDRTNGLVKKLGGRFHTLELWGAVLADELLKHLEHCYDPNTYAKFKTLFEDPRFKGLLTIAFQIMMAKMAVFLCYRGGETSGGTKNLFLLLPKTGAADVVRLLPPDLQKQIHTWFTTKPKAAHSVVALFQELLTSGSNPFANIFLAALNQREALKVIPKDDFQFLSSHSPIGSVLVYPKGGKNQLTIGDNKKQTEEGLLEPRTVKQDALTAEPNMEDYAKKQIKEMLTAVFESVAKERFVGETTTKYGHKINAEKNKFSEYNFGGSFVNTYPCYSKKLPDGEKKNKPFDDVMIVIESRAKSLFPQLHDGFKDAEADFSNQDVKDWDKFRLYK